MIASFVIFLAIALSVYLGMHYYVYTRIAHGLLLSAASAARLGIFFLIAALSFPLGELLSRQVPFILTRLIGYLGSVWLGIITMAVAIFLLCDIIRLFAHTPAFRYHQTVAALILLSAVSAYSLYNVSRQPAIKEITVKLNNLPAELSGFTIVQLSDLHLNFFKSNGWLANIASQANRLNPDIVVITGDLIDADICRAAAICQTAGLLKSKYGIYAVTGNHEYYAGIDKFLEVAKMAGFTVLRNSMVTVAEKIELAGIDDSDFLKPEESLPRALEGRDKFKPLILLAHRPDIFDKARAMGVDLQLSGHTHAGQIPPMDAIVNIVFKYPAGLYKRGASYIYTSPGTGWWGPPMRLFSRSEITKITLSSE